MTLRSSQFWSRVSPAAIAESEMEALVADHKQRFGEFWQEALRVTLEARNQTPAAANVDLFDGINLDPEARRCERVERFCSHYNQWEHDRIYGPDRGVRPPAAPVLRAADYWAAVPPVQTTPRDFPA